MEVELSVQELGVNASTEITRSLVEDGVGLTHPFVSIKTRRFSCCIAVDNTELNRHKAASLKLYL